MNNTINDIISSLCKVLFDTFDGKYDIYTEQVKQGMKTPCFFCTCLKTEFKRNGPKIFNLRCPVIIQFIPNEKDKEQLRACNYAASQLWIALELIEVKGILLRGSELNGEIVDGVLTFTVTYKADLSADNVAIDSMGNVELNIEAK